VADTSGFEPRFGSARSALHLVDIGLLWSQCRTILVETCTAQCSVVTRPDTSCTVEGCLDWEGTNCMS
jgi:hypothetical protein